ncbi:MAG: hypothetical protein J6A11_04695 [Lachnospiraceae bacterium]|nr:hypothetical protein [Lachnospiraceae bacterium]
MACFVVPMAEAMVATTVSKVLIKKEEQKSMQEIEDGFINDTGSCRIEARQIKKLSNFLWGGSGLLAFEHLWHGEIMPYFPFLTAANNPADLTKMLHEMSTVGVTMAVVVTLFWGVLTFIEMKGTNKKTVIQ